MILIAIAYVIAIGCRGKGGAVTSDTTAAAAPAGASAATPTSTTAAHTGADTGGADKEHDAAGSADDDEAAVPPVVGAHTAVVARQAFGESITAIGVVAPRPGHYAELAPAAPARVARIFVAPGDRVNAGDPLVEFERAPFDAAAASADAALTVAQHAYDRAQRLAAAGIAARKDVDQAAADLASARSADVAAQRTQQLATLRAPFGGAVTHLSAVLGASADPGQPVASIADPKALDLVFSLSPAEAARVHSGAAVASRAGRASTAMHSGRQSSAPWERRSIPRHEPSRCARGSHIRRACCASARPSSAGSTPCIRRDAATVPVQALVPEGDGLKVFVVGTDGLAHARPVTVGGRTETTGRDHRGRSRGRNGRHRGCLRSGGQRQGRASQMKLFDVLSAQRRFVYLVVALLSAAGVWAATRLPSAIYPELTFPRITIVARGLGSLGARQVVFGITRPIEEAVSVVPGVIARALALDPRRRARCSITFAPNTDMAYALQQVQARVNQVRGDLPAGLDIQVERLTPSLFPILSYNLEGGDPATLYDIARYQIRPLISRVPGVGRVDVQGTDVREIEVVCATRRASRRRE